MGLYSLPGVGDQQSPTIYKVIDQQGRVSYSTTPPTGLDSSPQTLETMIIAPGPNAAEQRAARQQMHQFIQEQQRAAYQQQRIAEQQTEARQHALDALAQAQQRLDEARQIQTQDWQQIVNGGRVLSQAYFERVRQAEEAVQQSRQALQRLR
jgi:methyl-accepting chemotaxis protein